MSKQQLYQFEISSIDGVVDAEKGVIEGVSVITGGVQAKGHNLEVDDTTLQQMLELGVSKEQVPVKWNHKSGADAVNGYFTNFRIEGRKLKADWHLLKSHSQYDHALELAERMPKNVGFSASFLGMSELADGTKVFSPDEKTKSHYTLQGGKRHPVAPGTKIFARCTDLISVDLVASPAANPDGMFEAQVDSPGKGMAENEDQVSLAALLAETRQFHSEVRERLTHLESLPDVNADEEEEEEEEQEEEDGAEGADFSTLSGILNYFENRLDQAASDAERQEFEDANEALEFKVGQVLELNQQLVEENRILAEAYRELSAKTKTVVEFSAGADGERKAVVKASGGRKQTDFEKRVDQLKTEGKSPADALAFAVEEDSARYETHLQAKGVFAQTL